MVQPFFFALGVVMLTLTAMKLVANALTHPRG